jgi:ABC-type cobalamin transport system ATPase subunit
MAGREPGAGSFMPMGTPGVWITLRLMALTSGNNLHIIGARGAARDLLRAMAANMKSEGSIVLRHSILCAAPTLCRKVGSAG